MRSSPFEKGLHCDEKFAISERPVPLARVACDHTSMPLICNQKRGKSTCRKDSSIYIRLMLEITLKTPL